MQKISEESRVERTILSLSQKFSATDAEVTFVSVDHVAFKIHLKNLEVCTGGFPPSSFRPENAEVTQLAEDSDTLELLFAFIYPTHHPRLDDTPAHLFLKLAEAAEKYQVYATINLCYMRAKAILTQDPVSVMTYAFKYNHSEMMNEAAPRLLDTPLEELIQKFPIDLFGQWAFYYESYRNSVVDTLRDAKIWHSNYGRRFQCAGCPLDLGYIVLKIIGARPLKLSEASIHAALNTASKATNHIGGSDYDDLKEMVPKPPVFTTFMQTVLQ